jgi:glycosyltransferase involved in cell wall biosynthesis
MPPKEKMNHRIVEIPSFVLPFNSNYKASLPYFSNKLTKELTDFNPDVIHIATPSPLGFFGLYYAKRNHIPTLSIYHTNFLSYMKHYFKSLPFLIKPVETIVKYAYRSFYNFCKTVYVPTLQMIRELKECGVAENNLKLWQRGIAVDIFNPSKKDKNFIRQLTGNDKPNILFASRLVWEKNMETLFNIYDEVQAQQLDVNFIIAGSGVAEQEARKRMKKAFFLGFLDHENLAKVYASSDVFVFPSVSETFGNVVVEAMACGCVPVIARGGGSQALVKNGETGFLCEPCNAAEYVENMKTLLTNLPLKEKMQSRGVEYASTLNWDHLVNEYFTDLETLATHHYSSYTNEAILPNEIYPTNFAV